MVLRHMLVVDDEVDSGIINHFTAQRIEYLV